MNEPSKNLDAYAVVIGGGFYGSAIALYLRKTRQLGQVILLERESGILTRASFNNQARIHNGYHYPRSLSTAFSSRINAPRFIQDWHQAVKQNFIKLYAIARSNSKVNATQFRRFCHEIGAAIQPADEQFRKMFSNRLIEEVFFAEEYVFNATLLAKLTAKELHDTGVQILDSTTAVAVSRLDDDKLAITIEQPKNSQPRTITCRYAFNCTYSGLHQLLGLNSRPNRPQLKHEITELALIQMPSELNDVGVTIMDGPFFSAMPFPAKGLHTLSHVRYTPHTQWLDKTDINPYQKMAQYEKVSRFDRMLRDAQRYIPAMANVQHQGSIFEVKTVLLQNETDDGRPILLEKYSGLPNFYSVLGSKIDNVYDVLERMNEIEFV